MTKVDKKSSVVQLSDVDCGTYVRMPNGRVAKKVDMTHGTETISVVVYLDGFNGWDYVSQVNKSVEILSDSTLTITTNKAGWSDR